MAEALDNDTQMLSTELKDILLDDLITAFESRLKILEKAQSNPQYLVDIEVT